MGSVRGLVVVGMTALAACGEVESPAEIDASPGRVIDASPAEAPDANDVDAAPDAAPLACGSPNTATCVDGHYEACGSDGLITASHDCALGCAAGATPRCNRIVASNGLAPYVVEAETALAGVIPDGARIDTDSGVVTGRAGNTIELTSITLPQPNGPELRAYLASSFTIGDVLVRGARAVAFVAAGPVVVEGVIDASGDLGVDGPGAGRCGVGAGTGNGSISSTAGHWERTRVGYPAECAVMQQTARYVWMTDGPGGGSYGGLGASGGGTNAGAAGAVSGTDALVPLRGGCRGGQHEPSLGGGGGGAVQVVSNSRVTIRPGGAIHVGGGGGAGGPVCLEQVLRTGGGGSGGAVLVEAPVVELVGERAGLVASGGAGGSACGHLAGEDAAATGDTAVAPDCPATQPNGKGGAGAAVGPAVAGGTSGMIPGGGGGGLGRVRVNTMSGTYQVGPGAVVRGVAAMGTIRAE